MGRRVKKALSEYNGTDWTETSTTLFVYDGWNLIQELDGTQPTPTVQKSYAWGLDLSQSLQGAGGVGGLLAMTDGTSTYLYCYDGNGNVGQLVNAATGDIAAHYEYDPFGKTLVADGTLANANPFRFSTKFRDAETGLIHYTFRDYDPELGRWLSRDPIGEEGGKNLYAFVDNAPNSYVDPFGLWKKSEETGKKRQVYIRESTQDTLETLAEIVKLDATEASKWAKIEEGNISDPIDDDHPKCKVSVPNIWIAADVGGNWTANPFSLHFYAKIGMAAGRFFGTDVATSDDYYKIKPNSATDLYSEVQKNINDIWGMVVFGHGSKNGYLGNYKGTNYINQSNLIVELRNQKFKLAKAYLFQCYSGYQGSGYDIGSDSGLANDLGNVGFPVTTNVTTIPGTSPPLSINTYTVDIDWEQAWKSVARDPRLYSGQDWIIDMPF
jgi:RHS repeat-associated protein